MKQTKKFRCLAAAAGAVFLLCMTGCSDTLVKGGGGGGDGEFEIVLDSAVQDFVKVLQTRANEGELVTLYVTGDNSKNFRVINTTDEAAAVNLTMGKEAVSADILERLGLDAKTSAKPSVFMMPKSNVAVKSVKSANDSTNETPKEPDEDLDVVVGSPESGEDPKDANGKSMNNSLMNLSVGAIAFIFNSPQTKYDLTSSPVIAEKTSITVTATASSKKASISINGGAPALWTAEGTVPLNDPGFATKIVVKVTAENAANSVTYTAMVFRKAQESDIPDGDDTDDEVAPEKNANLKWLEPLDSNQKVLSSVIVWPRVCPDPNITYELFTNDLSGATIDLRVYTASKNATVTVTDATSDAPYPLTNNKLTLPRFVQNDSGAVNGLTYGNGAAVPPDDFITKSKKRAFDKPVTITVTSADGTATKTYKITHYSYIGNGGGIPQAMGGHIKFVKEGDTTYEIHTFWDNKYKAPTLNDTFSFITKYIPVDTMWVLAQGGGGKAGKWVWGIAEKLNGGGGGAGYISEEKNYSTVRGTPSKPQWSYPVTAGRGGMNNENKRGESGEASSFPGIKVAGGGGGWNGGEHDRSVRQTGPHAGGQGEPRGENSYQFGYGGGGVEFAGTNNDGNPNTGKDGILKGDDKKFNRGGAGRSISISGNAVSYSKGGYGGSGYLDSLNLHLYDGYGGNQDTITWKPKEVGYDVQYDDVDTGYQRNGGPGRVIVRFVQDWDRALGK